jgi:XTP/dITP diphosphohydrolase
MELIFATNNFHKLSEIRNLLQNNYQIAGLKEMGINEEIPENRNTLEGNAVEKAQYIFNKYNLSCFADDTGLEVDILNGKPGVFSARYAGEGCSYDDNVNKLLYEMKGCSNRMARFRTVIALAEINQIRLFEGTVEGHISEFKSGNSGFGYDPVFIPQGFSQSFAEMSLDLKNTISHRAKAMQKLISYLNSQVV